MQCSTMSFSLAGANLTKNRIMNMLFKALKDVAFHVRLGLRLGI